MTETWRGTEGQELLVNAIEARRRPAFEGTTWPDDPRVSVERDEAVASIDRAFNAGARTVYVRWPTGAGKTVLLAQFVKAHAENSVAYFVGADMWSAQPQLFLFDLCQQLLFFLSRERLPPEADHDRVRQLFPRLWEEFRQAARFLDKPHFLVVDSLDLARSDASGESIQGLLPRLSRTVLLLASGSAEPRDSPAGGTPVVLDDLPFFGRLHTDRLFDGLDLTKEQIGRIHSATGGLPAYLAEVRRQLENGASIDDLGANLPNTLAGFLERDWQGVARDSDARRFPGSAG